MKKQIIITTCNECPFHNFDDSSEPKKWGISWCEQLDIPLTKHIQVDNGSIEIPDECPLPTIE